jgi:vacuolar-type H+-ATPase subunit H
MINIDIPAVFVLGLPLLFLVLYKVIYRKDKQAIISEAYMSASEEMKNATDNLMHLNKKYNKRGKNKIKELEYIKIGVEKATKELKRNKLNLIVPVLFALVSSLFTLLNGNIVDTLLFFMLICILEYFIFIPMYKFTKEYNEILLKKYSYVEENNIPISEWE